MPLREDVFENNGYYHIFDKTIDDIMVFSSPKIAYEFISTFLYYRSNRASLRYSKYKKLVPTLKRNLERLISYGKYFKVNILAYCIMPNHYHLLLQQTHHGGIQTFMANTLNSITRFYNLLHNRKGPIFLTQFKSKKIHTEEQLVYVSRYIHTNLFASSIVKRKGDIFVYPYSSIHSYLRNSNNQYIITKNKILTYFGNDKETYMDFIIKNADRQKEIEHLKYTKNWLK